MKFLIVRLSSLGDIVHTLPLVSILRQRYPDAQIDWLTGKDGIDLLPLIKEINRVYLLSLENLARIKHERYEYIIDVQGLFKTALISRFCSSGKVIGFKKTREFADLFYDIKVDVGNLFKTKEHVISLNLKLLKPVFSTNSYNVRFLIPEIKTPENIQPLIENGAENKIAVFPSTTWSSKLWPLDYWFELLKRLSEDFSIFLLGSKTDESYIEPLVKKLEGSKISFENFIGKTNVKDLIYILQRVSMVIGSDSGGLHVSGALKSDYGKPETIGIYGPTSVFRNGLFNQVNNCLYLSNLECISCRKKICPLGHHKCMNDILPEQVLKIVYSKL